MSATGSAAPAAAADDDDKDQDGVDADAAAAAAANDAAADADADAADAAAAAVAVRPLVHPSVSTEGRTWTASAGTGTMGRAAWAGASGVVAEAAASRGRYGGRGGTEEEA